MDSGAPDQLLSCSLDGSVRAWDLRSGQQTQQCVLGCTKCSNNNSSKLILRNQLSVSHKRAASLSVFGCFKLVCSREGNP